MKTAIIFISLIFLFAGIGFASADLEDLDVATCTYAGCSVSEYNTNNTNTASALPKNAQDDLTWTDTSSLGVSDTINDVKFHLRWSGTTNLDGDIDLTFNGVASECIFQIPENVNADNYNVVDISDCGGSPWTKADLDAMTLTVRNSDAAGGATLTNHFGTVAIDFTVVADNTSPKWFTPLVNDSTPSKGDTVRHDVNWTDDFGLNYSILEINSTGVNCDTTDNVSSEGLSGLSQYSNLTWLIPDACEGKSIGWRMWANDTTGNSNVTTLQSYQVQSFLNMTYTHPTPVNTSQLQSPVEVNVSIEDVDELKGVIFNWNGTNFTLFDNDTRLFYNLDNVSVLGENNTQVSDASGWGNDGVAVNEAQPNVSGRYRGSWSFDGTADYISVENSASLHLNNSDEFTLSAWVRREDTENAWLIVLAKGAGTSYAFQILDSSGAFGFWGNIGGTPHDDSGSLLIPLNEWTHVVIRYNGSSVDYFLNGTKEVGFSASGTIGGNDDDLRIGSVIGNTLDFGGSIDEVMISQRAFSDEEINQTFYSNLYKYDVDKWGLYVNQSNLADGNYTFFACANDSLIANCTGTRQVNVTTVVAPEVFLNLTFIPPTPANDSTGEDSPLEINISIEDAPILDNLIFNWNGTNFTMFNGSTILLMNFNNFSALDENNTYFVDVSGNGHNGTPIGNARANISGRYGQGLNLGDGKGIVNLSTSIDEIRTITVSAWVYHTAYSTSSDDRVVSKAQGDSEGQHSFMISTVFDGWRARILAGGGGTTLVTGCENTHALNRWEHIVLTYNGTTMVLYVNGSEICQAPHGIGGLIDDIDAQTFIGSNPPNHYANFTGIIDEVMILNRSMDADEVQQLYFSTLYKISPDNWILSVNQSINHSAPLEDGNYTFYAWGDDSTTTNSTGIWRVEIGEFVLDTSFTVSLPTGITEVNFSANNKTVVSLHATGQNDSYSILVITNTGTVGLDIFLDINQTEAGFVLFAKVDNDPVAATVIIDSPTLIKDNLGTSSSQNIWLWLNWTEKTPQTIVTKLNASVQQN